MGTAWIVFVPVKSKFKSFDYRSSYIVLRQSIDLSAFITAKFHKLILLYTYVHIHVYIALNKSTAYTNLKPRVLSPDVIYFYLEDITNS